jgi:hypothetical protein
VRDRADNAIAVLRNCPKLTGGGSGDNIQCHRLAHSHDTQELLTPDLAQGVASPHPQRPPLHGLPRKFNVGFDGGGIIRAGGYQ